MNLTLPYSVCNGIFTAPSFLLSRMFGWMQTLTAIYILIHGVFEFAHHYAMNTKVCFNLQIPVVGSRHTEKKRNKVFGCCHHPSYYWTQLYKDWTSYQRTKYFVKNLTLDIWSYNKFLCGRYPLAYKPTGRVDLGRSYPNSKIYKAYPRSKCAPWRVVMHWIRRDLKISL
jgi:hypothetical protein